MNHSESPAATPSDKNAASPAGGPPITPRRRWVFRLIALAIPLLLLALSEGGLRLAGYGGHPPLLVEMGTLRDRHFLATAPAAVQPFFGGGRGGSMDPQVFTMPKPAGLVRIVIVGGSAAQGYPQPRPLKFSAFLEAMLRAVWPQRQVEVLNLGTTAVASFPVACIAAESLACQPDLVVVYSGNNEFYGAGGVASTFRWGRSARMMRLAHALGGTAIAQALRRPAPAQDEQEGENLMDVVFADAQIAPDDPRRQAAARNLADNIASILQRCAARGIPVIVCTCPGNERDLAPIGEDPAPALAEAELRKFNDLLARGRARAAAAPAEALADLDAAAALHADHAALQYARGECLQRLGRSPEAAAAFDRARDLDTMPWRAPSSSNDAIRAVAHDVVLCDLERAFEAASPDGSIGWELMDDHVHPALAGQLLIARSLGKSMGELTGAVHVDQAAWAALPDDATWLARQGANPLDAYRVTYRITDLFEREFFKRSNPDALTRFEAERKRLEGGMSALTLSTIRRLQESRSGVPIAGAVGEAELLAGRFTEAAGHLAFGARAAKPLSFHAARYACLDVLATYLADASVDLPRAESALDVCRTMRALADHATPLLDLFEGCVLSCLGRHAQAAALSEPAIRPLKDPLLPLFASRLVTDLVALDRVDDAKGLLRDLHLTPRQLTLNGETSARLEAAY